MAFPVTLNGRTYTLADFSGTNYVDGFPDALEDFVTQAGNIYTTTSTSSVAIGTGSKTFTVADSGKPYTVGTPLRIADAAAPATNWIDGIVTSYSGTTLVVNAVAYAGSGTKTSWNINIGGGPIAYTGTLPVAQGGTGATTEAAARTNLDVYSKSEADSRFLNVSGEASNVTMTGNVTIGDAGTDTLTVNATATMANATLTTADINGGTIDAVTIGTNSPATEVQIDNLNINGNAIISTNTNGNIALTPSGTGEVDISKVDIDGGTIDGTVIGGATPAAGTFSDLVVNGNAYPSDGALSNRNKILNGAMVIDQRNAGAAVSGDGSFAVDRFNSFKNTGTYTGVQSSDAPEGFVKSYLYTNTSATTTTYAAIAQIIEGNNVADLNWGSASAQSITLSFWVKCSLTGTFGVSFRNGASDRSYVASYTVNSANTWEHKIVVVSGDVSGTWLTTNGAGIRVWWDLGVGAGGSTTAGSWQSGNFFGLTGGVKLTETNGATFYLTGVQLEAGDTATPFEHRSYGQELALCQRYYQVVDVNGTVSFRWAAGYANTGNMAFLLPTPMRSSATFTSLTTLTSRNLYNQAADSNVTSGGMTASLSIGRPTAIQIFVGSVSGSLGGSGGDPFIISGGSETLFAFDSEL